MMRHYTRKIMVAEIRHENLLNPIGQDVKVSPLNEIVGVLTTAVAIFNGDDLSKITDWREHLNSYLKHYPNINDSFECGFSGDHFWLHNGPGVTGETVVMIYLLKVKIDTNDCR